MYQDTPEVQWPPRAKALRPAYHPFVQYISSPFVSSLRPRYISQPTSNDLCETPNVTIFSRIMPSRRQKGKKRKRSYSKYIFRSSCNLLGAPNFFLFFSLSCFLLVASPLSFDRPWGPAFFRSLSFFRTFADRFARFHLATVRAVESRFENP